jgi:hypothetical protein
MQRSTVMKAGAVAAFVFGLPLLLAPNALLRVYDAPLLNGPGIYNSMIYGACLIAIGLMNWLASSAPAAAARIVIAGTLVMSVLGLVVAICRPLVDPTIPPAAWLNAALFLVFAVLYAGLYFRPGDAAAREATA